MNEPLKKISFGFTKSRPVEQKKITVKNDIQYIDCLESKTIKIKGEEPQVEIKELVIPVQCNKNTEDNCSKNIKKIEDETCSIDQPAVDNKSETLEAIAVREILLESQRKSEHEEVKVFAVPLQDKKTKEPEKEPTMEDYDNVPVSQFGLAMLRGMGWKPEKGIGKNERVVEPRIPVLRAKGLGLGAERKIEPPALDDDGEELLLQRGSFVQIVLGSNKNMYGQVQSFDDEGRVIIKAALGGSNISVNEAMIKVVTKNEYKKCSRVLNQSKYDECKRREEQSLHKKRKHGHPETNGEEN